MLMDGFKLKDLKKYYDNKEDAIKQAIINTLNTQHNMYGTRRFLYVLDLDEVYNDYYRVEVMYIDYFVSGPMEDVGVYHIHKEVI